MTRRTNPRTLLRPWAVVAATAAATMLVSGPAAALTRDDGDEPGQQLTTLQWLLFFIGIPALVIVVIWLLWSLPEWLRRSRGSSGSGVAWLNEPTWFGEVGGDGDRPALPAGSTAEGAAGATVERAGGGAHARW